MISFKEFLTEVRAANLFHGTSLYSMSSILKDNVLKANPTHGISRKGISLTRKLSLALDWAGHGWAFELDRSKLSHRYSIKPIEIEYYWATRGLHGWTKDEATKYKNKSSGLFEEYVDKDIININKYIVAIHATPLRYKESNGLRKWVSKYPIYVEGKLVTPDD